MRRLPGDHSPAIEVLREPSPGASLKPWQRSLKTWLQRVWLFGKFLESTQVPADDVVIGKTALVLSKISPSKLGEVRVTVRGGSEDYLALSETADIESNTSVTITAVRPGRTVVVAPLVPPGSTSLERA